MDFQAIRLNSSRRVLLLTILVLGGGALWLMKGDTAAEAQTITMQSGFPVKQAATVDFAGTTLVDLDVDGDLELLTADSDGDVWAWHHNGSVVNGYPLSTKRAACPSGERINGAVAVGNVRGDAKPEVLAGSRGCYTTLGKRGQVYMWESNGNAVSGWPIEMDWNSFVIEDNAEVYTVALGDVIGDAGLEVVAGTNNSAGNYPPDTPGLTTENLYVWTSNGQIVPGFPTWYRTAGIWGAVAVTNVAGSGQAEIITGRDHLYMHIYNNQGQWLNSNYPLRSPINIQDTNAKWGTYRYGEFTRGAPAVGDIDNDGIQEIAIVGKVRNPQQNHNVTGTALFVNEPAGNRQAGFEVAPEVGNALTSTNQQLFSASLGDLNNDGRLEIVVPYADGYLRVYNSSGTQLWSYNYAQNNLLFASEAAIGDISGDGRPDIIFGTYSPTGSDDSDVRLIALDANGSPLPGFPLSLPPQNSGRSGIRSAPTLGDIDRDCDVEIIAAGWNGDVYAWDLSSPYYPDKMPWPTARHDNWRSGAMSGPALFSSSCPPSNQQSTPTATATTLPTNTPTTTATTLPTNTPTTRPTVAPTTQPGNPCTGQLTAAADAYTRSDNYGNNNFGSDPELAIKAGGTNYKRQAHLRFNLSGLPSNMTAITQARLRLHINYLQSNTGVPLTLFASSSDGWSESGLTWNNQPVLGTNLGTVTAVTSDWIEFDVAAFLNSQLTGDKVASFILWDNSNSNLMAIAASRESNFAPVIQITAATCGSSATATPPPTASATPPPTASPTVSPTTPSTTNCTGQLTAAADAYTRSDSYGNNNYGSEAELVIKAGGTNYKRQAHLRFNLNSLPSTMTSIGAARLRLHISYLQSNSGVPLTLFASGSDNWNENTITWNNQPALGATLGTVTATNSDWIEFDVTSYLNSQFTGDKIASFILWDNNNTNLMANAHSRESNFAPMIQITAANCDGSNPPAPTPSPTTPPSSSCTQQLVAAADAYVRSDSYAYNNYGSESELVVKAGGSNYKRQTYLQFNLNGLSMSSISTAQLKLHINSLQSNQTVPVTAFASAADNWNEGTITWNNRPALLTQQGNVALTTAGWTTINITYLISSEYAGDKVASIILWDTQNTNLMAVIDSRETAFAPVLEVTGTGC